MATHPSDDPRLEILSRIVDGLEIAVLEICFSLHDKGVLDKDETALRLARLAERMPRIYGAGPEAQQIAFPISRLSNALKTAVKLDADGNVIEPGEPT
ncbi:hypothetical protein [Burkholderia gladioli]|uniref:hypothetical protein n=1 Tax=Burkholderia gladioli TaxID=28095 RepID=UPI001642241E|nr:hypothetical protein [Burkholderia gladioli]